MSLSDGKHVDYIQCGQKQDEACLKKPKQNNLKLLTHIAG